MEGHATIYDDYGNEYNRCLGIDGKVGFATNNTIYDIHCLNGTIRSQINGHNNLLYNITWENILPSSRSGDDDKQQAFSFEDYNEGVSENNTIENCTIINPYNESIHISTNATGHIVRNVYIQRFLRGDHIIGNIIKILIPTRYRENMSMLAMKLKKKNLRAYKEIYINKKFKEKLKWYYEESNRNLEKVFKLDISAWDK